MHRIKGGGKDGTKSPKERLFALVKYKGVMTLRYYDPKKTGKELGQIELTKDGKVKKGSKKDPTGYDKKVRASPLLEICSASVECNLFTSVGRALTTAVTISAVKDVPVQADRSGQEEP